MKIDANIIVIGAGATPEVARVLLQVISSAMEERQINTPKRVAAFLANVGVESNGLSATREVMVYSAQRLAAVWPGRYAVDPKSDIKVPNALALQIAGQPKAIANNVYANRLGNGGPETGDGYNFRGGGWLQATGRTRFAKVSLALGIDLILNPDRISDNDVAARSAAYIWQDFGCNELADKDMMSATVKAINGADPCDANKGPLRIARYRAAVAALKAS